MTDRNNNAHLELPIIPKGRTRPHLTKAQKKKTELCRNISEIGHCQYEDRCLFAHSEEELRLRPTNPRFRKEKCKTFHLEGFCGYGTRCSFQHVVKDELIAELDKMIENFWQQQKNDKRQSVGGYDMNTGTRSQPMYVNMLSQLTMSPRCAQNKNNDMTEELWCATIQKPTRDSDAS